MNRRHFLKASLAAMPLALRATAADLTPAPAARAAKGIRVGAKEDRYQEELLIMGGRFDLKVSSKDSGGDLCIYDTTRYAKGGPALHMHYFQDEWFYIIRGEFIARVGDDTLSLHPGDSAFAPRNVPHTFAMVGEGEGQMLVLFQPAGTVEDFFRKMAEYGPSIPKDQEQVWKELWESHGMKFLGPPLKF